MLLLWISVLAVAVGSAADVAILRISSSIAAWTAFWVMVVVHVVAESLLLGAGLGDLRPGALCIAAIAVALSEVALASLLPGRWKSFGGLVRHSARMFRMARRRHHIGGVFLAVVVVEYLWQGAQALRLPQTAWDGLYYHLIGPATWIQHGAIVHSPENAFADAYPQNQELVTGWVGSCTFTTGFSSVQGEVTIDTAAYATTTGSTVTFTVGSGDVVVSLPYGTAIGAGTAPTTQSEPTSAYKACEEPPGADANEVDCYITLPGSVLASGASITIDDDLPNGFVLDAASHYQDLEYYTEEEWDNYQAATLFTGGQEITDSAGDDEGILGYTSSNNGTDVTASFDNFDPTGVYILAIPMVGEGDPDGTYQNTATINGTTYSTSYTYTTTESGDLYGEGQGSINVTKALGGSAASSVPAGTEYTVTADDAGTDSTYTVQAGATTDLVYPAGAVVTLTEDAPSAGSGYTWGSPQFTSTDPNAVVSGDGTSVTVTVQNEEAVDVTLTNTASTVVSAPSLTPYVGTGAVMVGGIGWVLVTSLRRRRARLSIN